LSLDTHSLERHAPRDGKQTSRARAPRPRIATEKLKPALEAAKARARSQGSRKSAARRAIATPAAMRRAYLRLLAPAHRLHRDRHVEKLLFKPSQTQQDNIAGEAAPEPIYEGPIPGTVLDWIIADLDVTLRECAFVDFRAGRGRTLLYAAMHEFDRVVGYEHNEAAYEDAQLNISQFPRTFMACRDVECRRGDQGDIAIPEQPLVLFFPNAARERFLSLMLDHVAASYRVNPRRMYVIMENAAQIQTPVHDDIFHEVRPPLATRLKLKLFSPVDIRLFRSMA